MATGVELATAWVRLVPSFDGLQDSITKEVGGASAGVEKAGDSAGRKYGGGFKSAAGAIMATAGAVFLAQGVATFVSSSLTSLARIETINAQTAQVIESTGGAAGVSAAHVEALAGSLESLTATEAESVQEGANMLLTFKNIQNGVGEGNQIFDDATAALVDMSRAMGSDPQTAAIQLGKALNDPVAGISALSRVGIQFTDDQKAMIQSMVEAGDVAGAQKIILGELNSQFGGSGAAYAQTYQGQLDLLAHSFGTLGETVVGAVMPALQGFIGFLVPAFDWLAANQPVLVAIAAAIGVTLVAAFVAWTASIWASTIALLANPVTWIILAIIALIAAVVLLVMNWDTVVKWITDIWAGFISWITGVIDGFVSWWNGIWSAVGQWISNVWNMIVAGVTNYFNTLWNNLLSIGSAISGWWNGLWNGIASFFGGIWNGILSTISNVQTAFSNVFNAIASIVRGAFNGVVGFVRGVINGIVDAVNGVIGGINGVAGAVGAAVGINIRIPSIPRLADGATILPRSGGTLAILAEAGRPESVVDTGLMNRALEEGLVGGGASTLVVVDENGQLLARMRIAARSEVNASAAGRAVTLSSGRRSSV